jgi:competence protein ComEA
MQSHNNLHFTQRVVAIALVLAVALVGVAAAASGVVNINTATAEQLQNLPRVGPSVAQRIVEFREENGDFKAVEELLLVRGIGESTFDLIKPYVRIDGSTTLSEKVRVERQTDGSQG